MAVLGNIVCGVVVVAVVVFTVGAVVLNMERDIYD